MCGRYSLFAPPWRVEERFDATFTYPYERRYNAAPGQALPVVADDRPAEIRAVDWGLVPTWAEDDTESHINARAETVADKPSFGHAYAGRAAGAEREVGVGGRCLVLADGFYEWGDAGEGRRPFRVARTDGDPFAMAGLWTRRQPTTTQTGLDEFGGSRTDDEPDAVETFAILTTAANETVGRIHDRMPVVLSAADERRWLTADPDAAADLLEPAGEGTLEVAPVSRAVNDPSNDVPAVLAVDGPGGQ